MTNKTSIDEEELVCTTFFGTLGFGNVAMNFSQCRFLVDLDQLFVYEELRAVVAVSECRFRLAKIRCRDLPIRGALFP